VRNAGGHVLIHAEGQRALLDGFVKAMVAEPPPLAVPEPPVIREVDVLGLPDFKILDSLANSQGPKVIPPDHFVCADCLAEMDDPAARRYRYPFTNCTQCGPRYTLIDRLPYDRPNTAMARFSLCDACRTEYEDPADRRYHAQPLACPRCGPTLSFHEPSLSLQVTGNEPALAACVAALRQGRIVAVKGVGGYHLLCDARDPAAVSRLRQRKQRPDKPLAVMAPAAWFDSAERLPWLAEPDAEELALLRSPLRPIVLVRRSASSILANAVAPGLNEVGLMLPYSPLHHLLANDFDGPLVATSANLSGEPVLTDAESVEMRLGGVADAFLHHDRPILRPADDAVFRRLGRRLRPLRLGRGLAPVEMRLQQPAPRPVLALGADLKNTIALAVEDRVIISPHLGDLGAPRSLRVFEQVIGDLCRLFEVSPERILCDAHPGYISSRWAQSQGMNPQLVFHHHAHASAVHGEFGDSAPMLVFTWDGLGYGPDETLWGGEALLGRPGAWRRFASLRPIRLIGGDQASREPWRCALSVCLQAGLPWPDAPKSAGLAQAAWARGLNAPLSSSVGRLFDAAAALTGIAQRQSHEGHAAMRLEAEASRAGAVEAVSLPLGLDGDVWRMDWAPLLPGLLDERVSASRRAASFHFSLAKAIGEVACLCRDIHGVNAVGLTGGVFQNRCLLEATQRLLDAGGFEVRIPEKLPVNDAAISFGQIVEALARMPE
jgi:hydrogenase maturation protein HypF